MCSKSQPMPVPIFQSTPPCGGRPITIPPGRWYLSFQSTPPRVGGDGIRSFHFSFCMISIHAPRVGGDETVYHQTSANNDFNPRPPCGGRRLSGDFPATARRFQSTPPVWGATGYYIGKPMPPEISIHAPRVGGDDTSPQMISLTSHFNPRPPCGGRRSENSSSLHPSGSPLSA